MPERAPYCAYCPSRFAPRSTTVQLRAEDCMGPVYVKPATVVTDIHGKPTVRPDGKITRYCGREWTGITAGEGERIIQVAGPLGVGLDILVIKGAKPEQFNDLDEEGRRGINDEYEDALRRHSSQPRLPGTAPGSLVAVTGATSVEHVKEQIRSVAADEHLGHLALAAETVDEALARLQGTLEGTTDEDARTALAALNTMAGNLDVAKALEVRFRTEAETWAGTV